MQINENEITYSNLSIADDVGRVFHWRGGIYRGIYAEAVPQVHKMFSSGLLDELTKRGLFPHSKLTDYTLDEFPLVVEHKIVPFVTYPHEWSFDMFRDAALTVLDVIDIVSQFGWKMKDCHPYNILFDGVHPLYIDLGSFAKANTCDDTFSISEFLGYYWYPLSIWATGDYFLSQRIISSEHDMMTLASWHNYNLPLMRKLSPQLKKRATNFYKRIANRAAKALHVRKPSRAIANLASHLPAEFLAKDTSLLQVKIKRLNTPPPYGSWHDYHDEYFLAKKLNTTPRFDRIIEIVQSLGCESVVELAGNQGLLSLLLLKQTQVRRVVCSDSDSDAINRLYRRCLDNKTVPEEKTLQPAVTDIMIPRINFFTVPPVERFRSDIVTALAITHHLILSQNISIENVMQTIAGYTHQYALVEFMPLGLWDGKYAPPLPSWYNLDWFHKAFSEFFDMILNEQIETNRILYLGKLKTY